MRAVLLAGVLLVGTSGNTAQDCKPTLETAVRNSSESEIVRLLDAGCDVNAKLTVTASQALHYAKSEAVARLLVNRGARINATNRFGDTPLHHVAQGSQQSCCREEFNRIAKFLLENGADPNAKADDGDTPLHDALRFGSIAVVRLLVEAGATATSTNSSGETPIHLARNSRSELELLRNSASGTTALVPVSVFLDADDEMKVVVEATLVFSGFRVMSFAPYPDVPACRLNSKQWDEKQCMRSMVDMLPESDLFMALVIRTPLFSEKKEVFETHQRPSGSSFVSATAVGERTLITGASAEFALIDVEKQKVVRTGGQFYARQRRAAGRDLGIGPNRPPRSFEYFSEEVEALRARVVSAALADKLVRR